MVETATPDTKDAAGAGGAPVTPPVPRRPSGHRGADVRDTVAEMAARAQEISMEAGSKIAAAMKDVINAAAGVTGFATESARDLVQYMIRRGQMTQDEGEKLLREAEEANSKRPASARVAARSDVQRTEALVKPVATTPLRPPVIATVASKKPAKSVPKAAAKAGPAARPKPAMRPSAKPASKRPATRKPASKARGKAPSRSASKPKSSSIRPKAKAKPSGAKKKKR